MHLYDMLISQTAMYRNVTATQYEFAIKLRQQSQRTDVGQVEGVAGVWAEPPPVQPPSADHW